MAKKALRPTTRKRTFTKRFGKKKTMTAVRTSYGKSSMYPTNTISRFGAYPKIANDLRVRLPLVYNTSLSFAGTSTSTLSYWSMSIPTIPSTGAISPFCAAGLMHYLMIYQRAYVDKCYVKIKVINNYTPSTGTTETDWESNNYVFYTAVVSTKEANDLIFVPPTSEQFPTIPGAKETQLLPHPHATAFREIIHSVDVEKFIGGPRTDHTQAVTATETVAGWQVALPVYASQVNLPSIVVGARRNAANFPKVLRVELFMEFDMHFENVRPLENLASQMKSWTV